MQYTELHLHTTHTTGNATLTIEQAVARAKSYCMQALAIMDSGTMSGVTPFIAACHEAAITPIIGCGFYCTLGDHREPSAEKYHLPILAETPEAFEKLSTLNAIAHDAGMQSRPQIDLNLLQQYAGELIVFTGGRGGAVDKLLKKGEHQAATALLSALQAIVGTDHLFAELQDNGRAGDAAANRALADLATQCTVPCVATGGPFYLDEDDAEACNNLRRGQGNNPLSGSGFNFRSPQEQHSRFRAYPHALDNAARVAKRCSFL